jgi:hypothetical protein
MLVAGPGWVGLKFCLQATVLTPPLPKFSRLPSFNLACRAQHSNSNSLTVTLEFTNFTRCSIRYYITYMQRWNYNGYDIGFNLGYKPVSDKMDLGISVLETMIIKLIASRLLSPIEQFALQLDAAKRA